MRIDGKIDARRVSRAFRRSPRLMRDRVDRRVRDAAIELADAARGHVKAFTATNNLLNSIRPDKLADMDYLVGPHVQHGVYVELGTRGSAFGPPIQPIRDWVRSAGGLGITGQDADRVAWAVQRSLRKGTPAQPFMAPAQAGMEDRLRILVDQGIKAGLRAAGLR